MDQAELVRNERLIQKICDRILTLSEGKDEETKAGLIILALESEQTAFFGEKLIVQVDLQIAQLDPLKLQLLFLAVQKHLNDNYYDIREESTKKNKFSVVNEDNNGSIS